MRCPLCKGVLRFSFYDDVNQCNVYQCEWAGVTSERTIGQRTDLVHTTNHRDMFFIVGVKGVLMRVKPVRLSRARSNLMFKARGFPPYRDEATGTEEFPVGWTTARA